LSIATTVKRAPKWAWYTAGGVAVGGIGLRLWKNRQTPADTTAADQTATDPTDPNGYSYGAGGVSGVIVPPVIVGSNDGSGEASGLLSSVLGGVSDLTGLVLGSVETLIGPTQESQQGLIDNFGETLSTLAIMNAGSAPTASQNGAPAIATPVPAAPTPAPTPVIIGQTQQPTTWSCPSDYPHPGPNPGSCFKDVCLKSGDGHGHGKGLWHVYRDGTWHQVNTSC
jgi:hypothetical protein